MLTYKKKQLISDANCKKKSHRLDKNELNNNQENFDNKMNHHCLSSIHIQKSCNKKPMDTDSHNFTIRIPNIIKPTLMFSQLNL